MLVLAVEFLRFRPPLALRAWTRRAVGDPCSATNGGPTTTEKNSKKNSKQNKKKQLLFFKKKKKKKKKNINMFCLFVF